MLLSKEIDINVFAMGSSLFEQVGIINEYTSLIWQDVFVGYGTFELFAPITKDNAELIKNGNIIWIGGDSAAVIEIINTSVDGNNQKKFDVKGRTLEKFLTQRIIYGTYYNRVSEPASEIMYKLVRENCIDTDYRRKLPSLETGFRKEYGVLKTNYQKTGGEVYEALGELATESGLGFGIAFDPKGPVNQMLFTVKSGKNRTLGNSDGNVPVIFSTELDDILSSTYYINTQDEKTDAFIQGEDSGANRKSQYVWKNQSSGYIYTGFDRKELYVDARDLQSEVQDDSGNSTTLTESEYLSLLTQRGNEKLAEYDVVETFEAQVRVLGDVNYEYGTHYDLGDKVTVIDEQLGIRVDADITAVEESFSDKYALTITFGYEYPSLYTKVKRLL